MRKRFVTMQTWNAPVAVNRPDMGTYPVSGDCPEWQRQMRQVAGAPASSVRMAVLSSTGKLRCWEPRCNGVH